MPGILLDTHALLWWVDGSGRLSAVAQRTIAAGGGRVFVSAASAWEIATKYRLGKLPNASYLVQNFQREIKTEGFVELPITVKQAILAGAMAGQHKDPFDRMLIAQAQIENMALVSNDRAFDQFGITRIWE